MKLRRPQGGTALLLSFLILVAGSTGPQADLSPIQRDFRNLCQSLKMKCARSAPAKKTRKATTSRTDKKAKVAAPIPRSKPAAIAAREPVKTDLPTVKPAVAADKSTIIIKSYPTPRPKPEKQIASIVRPQKDLTPAITPKARPVPDDGCLGNLRNSGVQFDAVSTPVGNGRCSVEMPVRLHAVQTTAGKIALPDSPVLSCRFARQFALWLSDTGAALVSTHLDVKLAKVSTGPGYECRGRNGDASAKLSEHASGNAVDITTITTEDGRNIQVADAGNPASPSFKVLRGLRTTACGYFSTVLGPGSNEAHASHFHLDMGMHGKSQNYRICE